VRFEGPAAKRLAEERLQIGDLVYLALAGGDLLKDEQTEKTETPGRSVDYELKYRYKLRLEAYRGGKHVASLDIEHDESPVTEDEHSVDLFEGASSSLDILPDRGQEGRSNTQGRQSEWSSSDLLRSARLRSGVFSDPAYSRMDDLSLEQEAKRRKVSWRRDSSNWKFIRDSQSPTKFDDYQGIGKASTQEPENTGSESDKPFPRVRRPNVKSGGVDTSESSYNFPNRTSRNENATRLSSAEAESPLQRKVIREESTFPPADADPATRLDSDPPFNEAPRSSHFGLESSDVEPRTTERGEVGIAVLDLPHSQGQDQTAVTLTAGQTARFAGQTSFDTLSPVFSPRSIRWGEASSATIIGSAEDITAGNVLDDESTSTSPDGGQYAIASNEMATKSNQSLSDDLDEEYEASPQRLAEFENHGHKMDRESYDQDSNLTDTVSEHSIAENDRERSSGDSIDDNEYASEIPKQNPDPVVIDLLSESEQETDEAGEETYESTDADEELDIMSTAMLPPSLPQIQTQGLTSLPIGLQSLDANEGSPLTPVLHPLASAILPLPSPFPTDIGASDGSYMDRHHVAEPRRRQAADTDIHQRQTLPDSELVTDHSVEQADNGALFIQRHNYQSSRSAELVPFTATETHLHDSTSLIHQSTPIQAVVSPLDPYDDPPLQDDSHAQILQSLPQLWEEGQEYSNYSKLTLPLNMHSQSEQDHGLDVRADLEPHAREFMNDPDASLSFHSVDTFHGSEVVTYDPEASKTDTQLIPPSATAAAAAKIDPPEKVFKPPNPAEIGPTAAATSSTGNRHIDDKMPSEQVTQSKESLILQGEDSPENFSLTSGETASALGASHVFPSASSATEDFSQPPSSAITHGPSVDLLSGEPALESADSPSHLGTNESLESYVPETTSSRAPPRRTRASGHIADHLPTDWGQRPERIVRQRKTRKREDDAPRIVHSEEGPTTGESSISFHRRLSLPSGEEASRHESSIHPKSHHESHLLTPEPSQKDNAVSNITNKNPIPGNLQLTLIGSTCFIFKHCTASEQH
jgi:hypothetical protein